MKLSSETETARVKNVSIQSIKMSLKNEVDCQKEP